MFCGAPFLIRVFNPAMATVSGTCDKPLTAFTVIAVVSGKKIS